MKSAAMHLVALAAAVLATGSAHALSKKTFCTITINSSDEREVLRRKLPANEWRIVELVPAKPKIQSAGDDDDDDQTIPGWLSAACDKGIQCDAVAISGHFGGSFFGISGYELSLEQLERAACRNACDGIFKKPKEVFLMGCNTLSGKEKDERAPEEYLRVLLADGMDLNRAEQTVALRYSPWGAQNFHRMSNIFENTAKIYGFNSIGPSGATAGPRLNAHLTPRAKVFRIFGSSDEKLSTKYRHEKSLRGYEPG